MCTNFSDGLCNFVPSRKEKIRGPISTTLPPCLQKITQIVLASPSSFSKLIFYTKKLYPDLITFKKTFDASNSAQKFIVRSRMVFTKKFASAFISYVFVMGLNRRKFISKTFFVQYSFHLHLMIRIAF